MVYFGFIYPNKGVELLFEIAVPEKHHIVLVGYFNEAEPYHKAIMERVRQGRWAGKVTVAGFLPPEEAARILAAADAVILPFLGGGGAWNTSLHGAALQGTFVLTTSGERHGYDARENI
ncbi:MAG: glycosyltransferase, partial [Bdellovibrionota bacterium]